MKNIILTALLTIIAFTAFAQNADKEAFQVFNQARAAYENRNYKSSVELLEKAKALRGGTNIRIQPMLIRSLVGIEDWRQAKLEFSTYFNLNPDKSLVEYDELVIIERTVNEKIIEEEKFFEDAKITKKVYVYEAYLRKYPYGKYKKEAEELVMAQKDTDYWEKAQIMNTTDGYNNYMANYPNGQYVSEAQAAIKKLDTDAYEKARRNPSISVFENYLSSYPKGAYRSQATIELDKLKKQKEEEDFSSAKQKNLIASYQDYLSQYPKGSHVTEANEAIKVLEKQARASKWSIGFRYGKSISLYTLGDSTLSIEKQKHYSIEQYLTSITPEMLSSWSIAFPIEYKVSPTFSLITELGFLKKNVVYKYNTEKQVRGITGKQTESTNFLSLPIMCRFHSDGLNKIRTQFYYNVGIQADRLNSKVIEDARAWQLPKTYEIAVDQLTTTRWSFGLTAGVGMKINVLQGIAVVLDGRLIAVKSFGDNIIGINRTKLDAPLYTGTASFGVMIGGDFFTKFF
jgi:hypothetical protein